MVLIFACHIANRLSEPDVVDHRMDIHPIGRPVEETRLDDLRAFGSYFEQLTVVSG
jgi:hypothetical protein